MLETFFVKAVIVLWKRYGRYIFVSAMHVRTKEILGFGWISRLGVLDVLQKLQNFSLLCIDNVYVL